MKTASRNTTLVPTVFVFGSIIDDLTLERNDKPGTKVSAFAEIVAAISAASSAANSAASSAAGFCHFSCWCAGHPTNAESVLSMRSSPVTGTLILMAVNLPFAIASKALCQSRN